MRLPARNTDPETSKSAAQLLSDTGELTSQLMITLDILAKNQGKTSFELADCGELDRYQLARRLADLKTLGLAEQGAKTVCSKSGHWAVMWFLAVS